MVADHYHTCCCWRSLNSVCDTHCSSRSLVFFPWFFGVGFPLHGYLGRSEISVALIFGSFLKSVLVGFESISTVYWSMGMLDWELAAKMWDCKSFWTDSQFNRADCFFCRVMKQNCCCVQVRMWSSSLLMLCVIILKHKIFFASLILMYLQSQ